MGCSKRKTEIFSHFDTTYTSRVQQLANESIKSSIIDSIKKNKEDSIYYSKNRIWIIADSMTLRLPPSRFNLPDSIISYLETNGYTIPQIWFEKKTHNVISGSFSKAGQRDWAVLASKNRISSIMIFWNGSVHDITELEKMTDESFLQVVAKDSIGFSRYISTADTATILGYQRMWKNYAEEYGGDYDIDISIIDHDGIEEAFVEKASGIHYLHNKNWLRFSGAD